MDIGERIRKVRIQRGLTQKELAEMVGVDQTTISSYENGRRNIDLPTLSKIAKALHISLKDLVTSEVEVIDLPKTAKIVPLYSLPASAGNGMFPDEVYIIDHIASHRIDADFAIKAEGDSMYPVVPDGAILLIRKTSDARDGDMVLCSYDGHIFVKWLHKDSGNIYLISENPEYPPIKIEPHERFEIHGIVVDVIRGSRPRRKFR